MKKLTLTEKDKRERIEFLETAAAHLRNAFEHPIEVGIIVTGAKDAELDGHIYVDLNMSVENLTMVIEQLKAFAILHYGKDFSRA